MLAPSQDDVMSSMQGSMRVISKVRGIEQVKI